MDLNVEGIPILTRIQLVCMQVYTNPKNIKNLKDLQKILNEASPTNVETLKVNILSVFFPLLKMISEDKSSFTVAEKQVIVDTFKSLLDKITLDKLPVYFNIYGFLLFEIYDNRNHSVLNISEEYKLSIIECMTSLMKCLNSSAIEELYVKQNAPKLCQMMYVLLELAKNEQFRKLRISSINCIMAIAHVLDDNDFSDVVINNKIADIFLFFLPGISSQLKSVALIDEKHGHKIPAVALKAWGRIVSLVMQDYGASDQKINLKQINPTQPYQLNKNQWKNENELKEYLDNTERSLGWYKETDKKLQQIIIEFAKLTQHSHPNVRLELINMASLLIDTCVHTMPTSISHLIDIVIILSEDSDKLISDKSKLILESLSDKLTSNEMKSLLNNLEEGFYNVIASLPRKFNGIDEKIQIVAINSLIGYINLFGKHNLTHVLHSSVHLNRLISSLIHISEFDKSGISLLEEYTIPDYELQNKDLKVSWKTFRHFKNVSVLHKIETVCHLLAKCGASSLVSDILLDIISSDADHRKEAIFLLNEVPSGIEAQDQILNLLKNIISTYTDPCYWYVPLSVTIDENGYELTLGDVQNNIIQACLLVEGIGKIALSIKAQFEQFMLKTLYLVLERAGCGHPLVRSAGTSTLSNISTACNYADITQLITKNIDYFSFHIERKLNKPNENVNGLTILAVVMRYSSKEVLYSTCEVIKELLVHTYDKNKTRNLNAYLNAFKMFVQCLKRWLNITVTSEPLKTKKQKQNEFEEFQVSNIDYNESFSDDIMDKSAEELYKEDMEKSQKQLEKEINESPEEYKKPDPPIHIKLTVAILTKSLHFLPSKEQTRQLLVLEILSNGIEILKDWEDELLPIVHQIWSPLVDRFKETNNPLIVNYSFQLLVVLARLSKDFIRSRTAKDVLPNLLKILDKLSSESYLKDRGSAYRYTQNYKLQVMVLGELARVITDLDMLQGDINSAMDVVFKYISDKQPLVLQKAALQFFATLYTYDPETTREKLTSLLKKNTLTENDKNIKELRNILDK